MLLCKHSDWDRCLRGCETGWWGEMMALILPRLQSESDTESCLSPYPPTGCLSNTVCIIMTTAYIVITYAWVWGINQS